MVKRINEEDYFDIPENKLNWITDEMVSHLLSDVKSGFQKWNTSLGIANVHFDCEPSIDLIRTSKYPHVEIISEHYSFEFRTKAWFISHPFFSGDITYNAPDIIFDAMWYPFYNYCESSYYFHKTFVRRKGTRKLQMQ